MVKTASQIETIETLKNKIVSIYNYLYEHQDFEQAEKVKQLAKKINNREFLIAFCGHFSAGKSTMINQVVGESLLPSSPIPTSANLVRVKSGDEYAKVFFKNEKPRLYLAPYDYSLVKNYCKDGDAIEEIEISHKDSRLPENTVIMDTPGIDSADDAHRIATESALHLADLIFYVMDYNHVQAELNFLFTKELTEAGKDVYLVINQIDKHKDEELSFSEFQKSVVESFASWGVKPARIFYTSLKDPTHPFNEFPEFQEFINNKLSQKNQLLVPSVSHSLRKIAQDHIDQSHSKAEEKLLPFNELLKELTDDEKSSLSASYQRITSNLQLLQKGTGEQENNFDHEVSQIMKNAYLMPFQTRALAETYLESCQPEFKVGLLFSKQKTLEERNRRLESFYQDLADNTKSQLEWHLREFLLRTIKETELTDMELTKLAQSFSIQVPVAILEETVKSGARVTGDYVLRYTEDVANEVKRIARNQLFEFKDLYIEKLAVQNSKLKTEYEREFSRIERYVEALSELKKSEENIFIKEQAMEDMLNQQVTLKIENHPLFHSDEEEYEVIKTEEGMTTQPQPAKSIESAEVEEYLTVSKNEEQQTNRPENHMHDAINRLSLTSELVKKIPGFQKLSSELNEKAERLKNKGFTVALFGAFSAGKSSFANALMGEKVLPVSPNPTTAAINKIKPVTSVHNHGTVLVKLKEKTTMLEDVNRSLKVFNLKADDFQKALKLIDQILFEQGQEGVVEKTHFAFLQAFKKGFDQLMPLLGTVMETDINDFNEFVAKEEKSCYVEWIELYYDCELTRKGITLVDTPGADSINARHTGVAFDYIKNSDAILFVTYYNHAFSKADREFLIQLGRVKESFQMDKMFFVINAIDLAENDEEKQLVADYVETQLLKYGIRNPHLYPLSSLLALNEKENPEQVLQSGMGRFEQAFYQFISSDLTEMAIASAEKELQRVVELVNKLVESSKEDNQIKEKKRVELEKEKAGILQLLKNQSKENVNHRLIQEADELIYYIKQRVFLRFGDFFKEAFNPSSLRDDGRNLKKALQNALDDFLESLGYDFAQELRATTLRVDRFIERLLTDYHQSLIRQLLEVNRDISFSAFEKMGYEEIDFPSAFKDSEQSIFAKAFTYFKNPKSFFEKNEKQNMLEELHQILHSLADDYLKLEGDRLKHHYTIGLENEVDLLIKKMAEQTNDFYLSLLSTLDGGISPDMLTEIQQKLLKSM